MIRRRWNSGHQVFCLPLACNSGYTSPKNKYPSLTLYPYTVFVYLQPGSRTMSRGDADDSVRGQDEEENCKSAYRILWEEIHDIYR
jgi:hypothetical protein